MNWLWILVLVIIVIIIKCKDIMNFFDPSSKSEEKELSNPTEPAINYVSKYQKRYLLTRNEYREYLELRKIASKHDLTICPKVRLLDIIEPRKGESEYQKLFNKIQSKHVDFVICDKDLRVKAILELDDNTHNQKGRQERDAFVDQILTSVGYKIIHTRAITEEALNSIITPAKEEISDII